MLCRDQILARHSRWSSSHLLTAAGSAPSLAVHSTEGATPVRAVRPGRRVSYNKSGCGDTQHPIWRNETSVPGIGVSQESMVAGTRNTRFLRLVERAIAKLTS